MILHATSAMGAVADTLSTNYILGKLEVIGSHVEKIADPHPWTVWSMIIAVIATIISILGVLYSYRAAKYSEETAKHVHRVNNAIQVELLKDLMRHLYRNKICTLAMAVNMEKSNYRQYPAEIHLLKLKTLPGDIHLEQYNTDVENYSRMHELSLLLRNYNTEIEVAKEHFSNPDLPRSVKEKDMKGLLFKPFYLIYRIAETLGRIQSGNSSKSAVRASLSEHFSKLAENSNRKEWANGDDPATNHILSKDDKWLKKLIEQCPSIKEEDIFSKDNKQITGELRNIVESEYEDENFENIKGDEMRLAGISGSHWEMSRLFPVVLKNDLLIEIPKIGMISYPKQARPYTSGKAG